MTTEIKKTINQRSIKLSSNRHPTDNQTPMNKSEKIEEEKRTVETMIRLYCRHKEGNAELCPSCKELLEYSHIRLSKCPFGAEKKTCRLCPVHCYKPEMKKKMQNVMRYAGVRMLFLHPVIAIKHIWNEIK